MLRFPDARRTVIETVRRAVKPAAESTPIDEAAGRVLAEAIVADRDYPPFHRATRDGYAVRAADVAVPPATLAVIGEVRAGAVYGGVVQPGQCVSIMTGAPVPEGADAVVMLEHTQPAGGERSEQRRDQCRDRDEAVGNSTTGTTSVVILRAVAPGDNVVPRGSEAAAGSRVLHPGRRLGYAEVAMLASVGRRDVPVFRRPAVAILPTGDEVVDLDREPAGFQIRNSNSYSLRVQTAAAGGLPRPLPIAPDEPGRLRELIEEGLGSDLLLLSGGVSMGKYDLVEEVLRELGAEFYFDAVAIQPGKPLVFGRARGTFFFGLPGNPLSTMVTFELFARPAIELLAGIADPPLVFLQARLAHDVRHKPGLTRFLPAVLSPAADVGGSIADYTATVRLAGWQGSGDIAALTRANCYLVVPEDREELRAGEMVSVLPRG